MSERTIEEIRKRFVELLPEDWRPRSWKADKEIGFVRFHIPGEEDSEFHTVGMANGEHRATLALLKWLNESEDTVDFHWWIYFTDGRWQVGKMNDSNKITAEYRHQEAVYAVLQACISKLEAALKA